MQSKDGFFQDRIEENKSSDREDSEKEKAPEISEEELRKQMKELQKLMREAMKKAMKKRTLANWLIQYQEAYTKIWIAMSWNFSRKTPGARISGDYGSQHEISQSIVL